MSSFELLALIVFFLLGYWIVSAIWPKRRGAPGSDDEPSGGPGSAWPDVLGVSPNASVEEIRRAYEAQLGKYQPDKVAELGPERREVARRMVERIDAAYAEALRARS